jgi:hypothetical protein
MSRSGELEVVDRSLRGSCSGSRVGVHAQLAPLLVASIALLASACDPCSGIASCHVAPTVTATGQVIDYPTGRAISGATISFNPAAGAALGGAISGTTDGLGQFQLSGVATADGTITGDLTVRAPTFAGGYTVHGVQLSTSRTHGEGLDLGRVLAQPYFAFLGQVSSRFIGAGIVGSVHIQRVSGASLTNNDITVATDTLGRFYLEYPASSADPLIANVTISAPGFPIAAATFLSTALPVIWRDQVPFVNRVFALGPSLAYAVQAFHRGLDRGVPGVTFTWTRVSGIATTPTSLAGISNEIGLFSLETEPATEGTVTGDIVMTPPPPSAPQTFRGVTLQTFDNDSLRLLATYRFGPAALYAGELFNRATGALQSGVAVDFVPTGGVAAQTRTDTSNSVGRFLIAPYTDQAGIITGELHVHYLPPRAFEIIPGLQLQTFEDDSLRYLQRWGVGPSLLYVGELRRNDNDAPIVGAQVTFQRTGGIAVTPNPLNSTSIAGGRFSLALVPSTDGVVAGNLTVHAPPLRDTTIVITLPTFLSDEVRLLAVWRIVP